MLGLLSQEGMIDYRRKTGVSRLRWLSMKRSVSKRNTSKCELLYFLEIDMCRGVVDDVHGRDYEGTHISRFDEITAD